MNYGNKAQALRRIISSEIIWSCAELGASLDGDQSTNRVTLTHFHTSLRDVIHAAEVHSQQPTISFGQTQTYAHKMNWRKCCTWLTAVTHSGVWNQLWSDWRCLWFPSLREDPPNPPLPPLWIYSEKPWIHERLARDTTSVVLLTD